MLSITAASGAVVATPTFNPAAGTFSSPQSVTISCATSGASIRYTTDGSTPSNTVGTVYSSPVTISTTATLKAIGYKNGQTNSSVASGVYTISSNVVATPTFTPAAGTYSAVQTVTISTSTSGATIRYTTDGTTPTQSNGTIYSSSISIAATTTLKALAYKSGMTDSSVASGTYTINLPQVSAPTFSPVGGSYLVAQNVTLSSSTSGASIRYTIDGSTPSQSNGTLYSGAINVSVTTTIKAIAYKSGMTDSTVSSASYTLPQPPPTFSPTGGTYSSAQTVTMSTPNSAIIRYTVDGSIPTQTNGTLYAGPLNVSTTTIVKAIAYPSGGASSAVTSATYNISSAPGVVVDVIYNFTGGNDGGQPENALIAGSDGSFYGITFSGGASNVGTVFKITPAGTLTTMVTFNTTNGANPRAPLLLATDGNYYGTTGSGGGGNAGTVFKMTPAGVLTTLVTFGKKTSPPGLQPFGGLIQGTDGKLYGTTSFGGPQNGGTIYNVTTAGVFTSMASLDVPSNGSQPYGGLALGSDGYFYGTTEDGVTVYQGAVYKMSPAGVISTVASFNGTNGASADCSLVQGVDGNFYGTTFRGGPNDLGTVFKVTPSGILTTLVTFNGTNGSYPFCGLMRAPDNNFYGVTQSGGATGNGTVFRITPAGVFTLLYSFDNTNGATPRAPLLAATDGSFYGCARSGGAGFGVVYRMSIPSAPTIPTISVPGGTYTSIQNVSLSASGSSALFYTLDGSNPTATSTPYSGPISIASNTTLKAVAFNGIDLSAVASAVYTIVLPAGAPNYNPSPGTYNNDQTITLSSATPGAAIRYTTDGSDPTSTTGILYSAPFTVTSNTTLKAIAYMGGYSDSAISPASYLLVAALPTLSPLGGTFSTAPTITISTGTSGGTIRFTLDGTNPTETLGQLYSGPITLANGSTIKAIAFRSGYTVSAVAVGNYILTASSPTFATDNVSAHTVSITSSTPGATIRYTQDGSDPTDTTGTIYSGPITISSPTTLKAIAFGNGFAPSAVSSISIGVPTVTISSPANGSTINGP